MNGSNNQPEVPTISGPYLSPQQTETSPLRQNLLDKKKLCFDFFWGWQSYNDQANSLRIVIVMLFGISGAITLALLSQVYNGEYQVQPHGAVTSDDYECTKVGLNILKTGGNAIDAAIASTVCLGVVNFHVTGLGGGGYMMIYNHRKHKVVDVIDFREMVPNSYGNMQLNVSIVGLTVGIPGFLKGLWEAHEKYGLLPWSKVIMPSVELASNGFTVSKNILDVRSHLIPSDYNNDLVQFLSSLKVNDMIKLPALASTLNLIAEKGIQEFYNGSIAEKIIYSVKVANGGMTLDDISQYQTSHTPALKTSFEGFDVFTAGASSSGVLLLNSLNSIQNLDLSVEEEKKADTVLKMSDVLHDMYLSFLEKSEAFLTPPEPVASEVAVVDTDEIYVSVVSGLNTWLGSQILTEAGFILNNAIANFGINNERRPLSLSTPVIAVETNNVCGRRLILGSGDAVTIAQLLTELLLFNKNTSISVESPRFDIDIMPRHIKLEVSHEPTFSLTTIEKLKRILRKIDDVQAPYRSINVIEKVADKIIPYSDSRGGGASSQYR